MKIGGVASMVIGALLFLFGVVRFNSLASQFVQDMGGLDELSVFPLIAGGVLAIAGLAAYMAPETQAEADAGTNKCASCGRYNYVEATKCHSCGHALIGPPLPGNLQQTKAPPLQENRNPEMSPGAMVVVLFLMFVTYAVLKAIEGPKTGDRCSAYSDEGDRGFRRNVTANSDRT